MAGGVWVPRVTVDVFFCRSSGRRGSRLESSLDIWLLAAAGTQCNLTPDTLPFRVNPNSSSPLFAMSDMMFGIHFGHIFARGQDSHLMPHTVFRSDDGCVFQFSSPLPHGSDM
jgi:hypothetical protein